MVSMASSPAPAKIELEAVKQDGCALKGIKEQTPEICEAAVKQNKNALEYIKK